MYVKPSIDRRNEVLVVTSKGLFIVHRKLCIVAALVLFAHCVAMLSKYGFGHDILLGLVPLFDFYEEKNVPTYFSSISLLFASALIFYICRLMDSSSSSVLTAWKVLGIGFLFMSLDEFCDIRMILKRAVEFFNAGNGIEAANLGFSVAWTLPVAVLVVLLGVYFLPFLRSLPKLYAVNFAVAGGSFVLAALGLENIQGFHTSENGDVRDLTFMILVTIEELMEIGSILYFQYFLIRYIEEFRGEASTLFIGIQEQGLSTH